MGAAKDTIRGLARLVGCLGVIVAVIGIVWLVLWLLVNGVYRLMTFALEDIPEFWGNHWRWIVFPILGAVVLRIAREIGRK